VSRTASDLNASVNCRRVGVAMLTSNFIILPLMEVSVKSGEGQPSFKLSSSILSAVFWSLRYVHERSSNFFQLGILLAVSCFEKPAPVKKQSDLFERAKAKSKK
jgi:hypothetical protein